MTTPIVTPTEWIRTRSGDDVAPVRRGSISISVQTLIGFLHASGRCCCSQCNYIKNRVTEPRGDGKPWF